MCLLHNDSQNKGNYQLWHKTTLLLLTISGLSFVLECSCFFSWTRYQWVEGRVSNVLSHFYTVEWLIFFFMLVRGCYSKSLMVLSRCFLCLRFGVLWQCCGCVGIFLICIMGTPGARIIRVKPCYGEDAIVCSILYLCHNFVSFFFCRECSKTSS